MFEEQAETRNGNSAVFPLIHSLAHSAFSRIPIQTMPRAFVVFGGDQRETSCLRGTPAHHPQCAEM